VATGTGHEASFLALLYGLAALGCFGPADAADLATVAFAKYMDLMRTLQRTYVMEPAGSHGVWGLDDYHCLPFLLGAAQLCPGGGCAPPPALALPSVVQDAAALDPHRPRYLYAAAIAHVRASKTGAPFSETSPVLHSISLLPSWQKVYAGLLRTFEAEVLGKFPVIQHFLFGSLLPAAWSPAPAAAPTAAPAAAPVGPAAPGPGAGTTAPWARPLPPGAVAGGEETVAPWANRP
jgi:hypothetical protein